MSISSDFLLSWSGQNCHSHYLVTMKQQSLFVMLWNDCFHVVEKLPKFNPVHVSCQFTQKVYFLK